MDKFSLKGKLKYYHSTWLMVIILSAVSVLTAYSLTGSFIGPLFQQLFGIALIFGISKVSYKKYNTRTFSLCFFLIAAILLILTLIMKRGAGGRSISIGGVLIQTFYIVTICFTIYLCVFLARHTNKGKQLDPIQSFWALCWLLVFVVLIALRNFSTSVILLLTGISVLFVAGIRMKYLIGTLLICGILGGFYYAIGHARNQNKDVTTQVSEDRSTTMDSRIQYWLDGKCEEKAYGRQMMLSQAAISRSFFAPSGPGKGLIKKNMAEGENDFIFALICEEFHFFTGMLVFVCYVIIFFQSLFVARKAKGHFIRYYATGIGVLILLQAMIHIGANTSAIPATGQTLPLISRGSVSLFFTCFALGTLINMAKHVQDQTEGEDDDMLV